MENGEWKMEIGDWRLGSGDRGLEDWGVPSSLDAASLRFWDSGCMGIGQPVLSAASLVGPICAPERTNVLSLLYHRIGLNVQFYG
jgi:hypothetical protein